MTETTAVKISIEEAVSLFGRLADPQHVFTEWVENERAAVQLRVLQQKTRARGVRLARDEAALLSVNTSSAVFVGVPANHITRMDNITYRECWSHYLGTVSPVCKDWVGTTFTHSKGKKTVVIDAYGDSVCCAPLQGDY